MVRIASRTKSFHMLSLLYESDNFLGREKHNSKPYPAANHAHGRIRAGEHQRKELVALSKHNLVNQRAIRDQRYADGDIERIASVEQKEALPIGSWR